MTTTLAYTTATSTTKVLPPVFLTALITEHDTALYNVMLRTPDGLAKKVGTIRRDGTVWHVYGMTETFTDRDAATDGAVNQHRRTTSLSSQPAPWQARRQLDAASIALLRALFPKEENTHDGFPYCETCNDYHDPAMYR
jgi:hypothetical protein